MIINVVVIDDIEDLAESCRIDIESFQSKFAIYKVQTIFGDDAYELAEKHIQTSSPEIDILFVDYNLHDKKGVNLFFNIDKSKFLIYRVLYSVTDKSFHLTRNEYKKDYDAWCHTKDKNDIETILKEYESTVLKVKLLGNPAFQSYFLDRDQPFGAASVRFYGTTLFNVLYAKRTGSGTLKFFFRTSDGFYASGDPKRKHLTAFTSTGLPFQMPIKDIVINLLWVAKIDFARNRIRFILQSNVCYEIPFEWSGKLLGDQIQEYLQHIESLNLYFRR